MIYGYARVSTKRQAADGNSLEDQERKLREHGCTEIYTDSFTGTKMDRPEFSALMAKIQPGDTLVVTKLDRFARTAADGAKLIRGLVSSGVNVDILNMGRADNSSMGKLMVTILLAFAEFERDNIYERTQTGREIARMSKPNYREGRKTIEIDDDLFSEMLQKSKKGDATVAECCKALGISRSLWYNKVNALKEGAA